MNLVSFPGSTIDCNRLIIISNHHPHPLSSYSRANNLSRISFHKTTPKTACVSSNYSPSTFSHQHHVIKTSSFSKNRGVSVVPFDAKNPSPSGSGDEEEEDRRAPETVPLKLYSAIKNQNIVRELSDIIRDECRYICNFFASFQGKKQVLEFVTCIIRSLANNIELIVRPNLKDGMDVGFSLRLEWSKKHVPLGKGLSLYIRQMYHGMVMIRNVGMLIELLPVETLRLKIMENLMAIMDLPSSGKMSKGMVRKALYASLLALFFATVILLFSKPGFY